jgi:hypothetical protein
MRKRKRGKVYSPFHRGLKDLLIFLEKLLLNPLSKARNWLLKVNLEVILKSPLSIVDFSKKVEGIYSNACPKLKVLKMKSTQTQWWVRKNFNFSWRIRVHKGYNLEMRFKRDCSNCENLRIKLTYFIIKN